MTVKRFVMLALGAVVSCAGAKAQPTVAPATVPIAADVKLRAGEIALVGTVASVAGDSLVLRARAFALPNGKSAPIEPPKLKTVQLGGTEVFPQGDPRWHLSIADIATGCEAVIVGRDEGKGAPLKARVIGIIRADKDAPRDFFVTQSGSDEGDGSAGKPWRTLQKAFADVPDGSAAQPRVLHIGPGNWSESADGEIGQVRIANKKFLTITGAGARPGGTQITTEGFAKRGTGVLRIIDAEVRVCNLTIGDDRAWDDKDAFFEATVALSGTSRVFFEAIQILGPSRETTREAGSRRAPTALAVANQGSEAHLLNVLISGHGTFLSNPQGRVECRSVTFARTFGVGYDDNFLFLQTPQGAPLNERRYSFADCVFYELEGSQGGGQVRLATGETGEDKAWWDAPLAPDGGNILVRARSATPDGFYQSGQMTALFGANRTEGFTFTRAHGVWEDDDEEGKPTGALRVDNDVQLAARDDFPLAAREGAAPALISGWHGGFARPEAATATMPATP